MTARYRNIRTDRLTERHAAYLVGALSVWADNENNLFGDGEGTNLARRVLDGLIAISPEIVAGAEGTVIS